MRRRERRTLALASGGVAGLLYEVGALTSFDDVVSGFCASDFDLYMGVGSGAAAATLLAAGATPREIGLAFEGQSRQLPPFEVGKLFAANTSEILRKGLSLPRALVAAVQENLATPSDLSIQDILLSLTGVLPSGLYVTSYVESYVKEALRALGCEDSFESLPRHLAVVATDVDTGQSRVFTLGSGVPVSRAVAATAALPMLFAPVAIGGRHYVDGTTNKMLHLSYPLGLRATFIFCVSPIRPLGRGGDAPSRVEPIAQTGVVSVGKQALRTLLHSRLAAGLAQYSDRPRNVDIVLVEPAASDANALFYNVGKARTRALLKEAGYLRGRHEVRRFAPELARHGIAVRERPPARGPRRVKRAPGLRRAALIGS